MSSLFATLLVSLLGVPLALPTEVDNFTARDTLTEDALPVMNRKVNQILDRAVRDSNKESPDRCSRALLRQEIVRWTGPDPVSIFELWTTLTDRVQTTNIGRDQSIYSGVTLGESVGMWFVGIGRSFKLNGHVVGTDKLGHFFMQGLNYFKRVKMDGADLDEVLRNEHSEDGVFGMTMTGVKSYADMAVNYQGYRFWSELYLGINPYIRCVDGRRWEKQREFNWTDYVSAAWDEAINCSEMRPTLRSRVEANMAKLGLRCPIDPMGCLEINRLEKAAFFTSPMCKLTATR